MTTATWQLSISPTGQELDRIRRELLDNKHQQEGLITCTRATAGDASRLAGAVTGTRSLLDDAEERRRLH